MILRQLTTTTAPTATKAPFWERTGQKYAAVFGAAVMAAVFGGWAAAGIAAPAPLARIDVGAPLARFDFGAPLARIDFAAPSDLAASAVGQPISRPMGAVFDRAVFDRAVFDPAEGVAAMTVSGDDDDDDEEDDDDDEGRGPKRDCAAQDARCNRRALPAPGTMPPPQNGLFSNGSGPKVKVN